jgi:formylmethanofuran dehydrogenase subunit E-like metal-binding protein
MSIANLVELKDYLRELTDDLDDVLVMALDSATAECNHFVGFDVEAEYGSSTVPGDIVMACLLLAQVHFDAGDSETNEYRRTAAHRLLQPYRLNTGIGSVPIDVENES